MASFDPVIKWSGSKRSQAKEILKYFPKAIKTYYEPFVGGASILYALLQSDIPVEHYICSDVNSDLISLYDVIKCNPDAVVAHYTKLWGELNANTDISYKKAYFETIRTRLNSEHNPLDFMFIMRTTTNGMPRYNSSGEFNNSFHVTRTGIYPQTLAEVVYDWSKLLNRYNVEFRCCSYEDIQPIDIADFMYLDPPYANTKGMYYGTIDYIALYSYIRNLPCGYAMSFDGKVSVADTNEVIDRTEFIPSDIYTDCKYIYSGNSSFRRVIGKSNHADVYESLYLKIVDAGYTPMIRKSNGNKKLF